MVYELENEHANKLKLISLTSILVEKVSSILHQSYRPPPIAYWAPALRVHPVAPRTSGSRDLKTEMRPQKNINSPGNPGVRKTHRMNGNIALKKEDVCYREKWAGSIFVLA